MQQPETPFKSGFIALIGRPNVGKSTLINMILNQKITPVSPRPQTTRRRQLGILTSSEAQMIFTDTPGIHKPKNQLGQFMNNEALGVIGDADILLWIVDASESPQEEDHIIAERLTTLQDEQTAASKDPGPVLLLLNKSDMVEKSEQPEIEAKYQNLLPRAEPFWISAHFGSDVNHVLDRVLELLPDGPQYYDEDQITDFYEREITADLIREACLFHLKDEIPHEMAVRIDYYQERGTKGANIEATLFVNRESHKGIVIGNKGKMIKHIGSTARQEIEKMSSRKVNLQLRVKVNKNWRDNPNALRELGYLQKK